MVPDASGRSCSPDDCMSTPRQFRTFDGTSDGCCLVIVAPERKGAVGCGER